MHRCRATLLAAKEAACGVSLGDPCFKSSWTSYGQCFWFVRLSYLEGSSKGVEYMGLEGLLAWLRFWAKVLGFSAEGLELGFCDQACVIFDQLPRY